MSSQRQVQGSWPVSAQSTFSSAIHLEIHKSIVATASDKEQMSPIKTTRQHTTASRVPTSNHAQPSLQICLKQPISLKLKCQPRDLFQIIHLQSQVFRQCQCPGHLYKYGCVVRSTSIFSISFPSNREFLSILMNDNLGRTLERRAA